MPNLRDHVRETLSAREPSDREARADLQAILDPSARRGRRVWPYVVAPALAAVAVIALVIGGLHEIRPIVDPRATAHADAPEALQLYLRVDGEPAERALALELTVKGTAP